MSQLPMTLLPRIGTAAFGLAGLAYSACATPYVKPGTPYVKPSVVVEAEQPQTIEERFAEIEDDLKKDRSQISDWARLTLDTFLSGEKVQGNFHDLLVYGQVRDPQDCIKVKEYETSQGNFAVVVPYIPEHLKNMIVLRLGYNEDPATEVVMERLESVASLKWEFECSKLLPRGGEGSAYALVLDDSTVLVTPHVENSKNPMFERHYSWESATAREQWRTGGPMDLPQYPITPKLEAMLTEAADGIEKIGESQ